MTHKIWNGDRAPEFLLYKYALNMLKIINMVTV